MGLINSETLLMTPILLAVAIDMYSTPSFSYLNLNITHVLPVRFLLSAGNSHFWNLQITLDINVIVQSKVNRELASLEADLTCTDVNNLT